MNGLPPRIHEGIADVDAPGDLLLLVAQIELQAERPACALCGSRPTNVRRAWVRTDALTLTLCQTAPGWAVVDGRDVCPACVGRRK